jgi:hypothetical protein
MLRSTLLVIACIGLILPAATRADDSLAMSLQAMDRLRNGEKTDLEAVETLGEELLKAHERPEEQAQIYYQLTHVHAQSGMKHIDKIQTYGQKALDSKLITPEQRGMLYSYLCSAHELDTTVKEFKDRRKNAVEPLLKGLAELQQFNLAEVAAEAPGLLIIKGSFNDRGAEEQARRRNEEAIRLRNEVIRTQTLIARRNTLTDQVKWLYAREPIADDELLKMAEKIVGEDTAKELVATAKKERDDVAKRREALKKAANKATP